MVPFLPPPPILIPPTVGTEPTWMAVTTVIIYLVSAIGSLVILVLALIDMYRFEHPKCRITPGLKDWIKNRKNR